MTPAHTIIIITNMMDRYHASMRFEITLHCHSSNVTVLGRLGILSKSHKQL